MTNTSINNRVESLAKGVGIPPQPDLVLKVLKEVEKDNADIQGIVNSISKDVSLSAKVLKVANSAFFRKGKVDTLTHAINILGIKNFYTIILIASLEEALQVNEIRLKKFWHHSKLTALASSIVAKKIAFKEEIAYMAGLFHDVGVSILLKRFDNYHNIQDHALYPLEIKRLTDSYDSITAYESYLYNTNHCVLAYAMSKSWGLSEDICQVILHHHTEPYIFKKDVLKTLLSILQLAELLSLSLERENFTIDKADQSLKLTLQILSLSDKEFNDMSEEIKSYIHELSN